MAALNLVTLNAGVPVTTSTAMAEGTDNDHASVIKLVRTYQADLEEFGGVGFEIQPFQTAGGQQLRPVAVLNEDQAILLLTYLRNNAIVRGFKVQLVKAFRALVNRATNPVGGLLTMPNTDMLRIALAMAEERDGLKVQAQTQQATIAVLAPKAAFADRVANAKGAHSIAAAAKMLGTGQNRLFSWLRANEYLIAGTCTPYQCHIETGLFRVVERAFKDGLGIDRLKPKTLITGKGLVAIQKKMQAEGRSVLPIPQVMVCEARA